MSRAPKCGGIKTTLLQTLNHCHHNTETYSYVKKWAQKYHYLFLATSFTRWVRFCSFCVNISLFSSALLQMVSDFVVSEVWVLDGVHCSVLLCPLCRLFFGVEQYGTSWLLSRHLCGMSSSAISSASKSSCFSLNPWSSCFSFHLHCDSTEFAFRKCLFSAVSLSTSDFKFLFSNCRCRAERSIFSAILKVIAGARPTKHISIEFEIRWKFRTL